MWLINLLIEIAKFFQIIPWSWKKGFFMLFILMSVVFIFFLYRIYQDDKEKQDLNQVNKQKSSENEALRAEIIRLNDEFNLLGVNKVEKVTGSRRTYEDFIRDWDISDFDIKDGDIICPKKKGKNNYQRMIYKYDTPLASSELDLKFKIVDQDDKIPGYLQRIVVGMQMDQLVASEFDIPTRNNQVVNFREASDSGELVSGGEGKSINSPIREKSTINLKFQTKSKLGQEITQILALGYISAMVEYGDQSDSLSYDLKVNDSHPESARAKFFFGSYLGGCIKVIDWNAG